MKTQTVYKVLSRFNKKLFSYAGTPSEAKHLRFCIRYSTKGVNKPRKNHNPFLFCFDTLEHARKLVNMHSYTRHFYAIYEAQATNVSTTAKPRKAKLINAIDFRPGTLFASSLKLTKRIG